MHRFAAAALTMFFLPITGAAAQQQSDSAQQKSDSAPPPPRARPLETVVVSATRTDQSLSSLAAQVVVLGEPDIAASTAQTVPDLLRIVPGFTTRDFQAGIVIPPSGSMVSFRGLGGSSAGRALVLLDGIPAGDPFSGWLDWGRIPLPMLQSAEVVRGGGSTIWGSRSLGGVINLRTLAPRRDEQRVTMEGGSLGTYHAAGAASIRRGKLSATLGGDLLNTEGYVSLRADQAGPIDRPEGTTSRALLGKATWDATDALQVWAGGGIFTGGDRPLGYKKRQDFDEGRGGLRWLSPDGGIATLAVFANRRSARAKSWTINADRTAETPQRYNDSPASSTGISLQWTQMAFARHELTAGADFSSAVGSLTEQYRFVNDQPLEQRDVGGRQQLGGVFLQDAADLGHDLRILASVRADRVSNTNGWRTTRDLVTGTTIADSAFRDETTNTVTYSLGVRWQHADMLAWRASVYEGFRAPSMYEMYYPRFSARGTVTEANPELDPERLRGAELGADLTLGSAFVTRITAFRNRVASPIIDVTFGTAGAQPQVIGPCGLVPARQTCGQRLNVPELRSNGIEADVEWQPSMMWRFSGGYSLSATRVVAPGQPVDGKQAIRAARHTVTSNIVFDSPRWFEMALEGTYVGPRFDDDLNEIKLAEFYLVGLRLNRDLGQGMTGHIKVANLFNEKFEVARTRAGLADMGAPRWISIGVQAVW
ncbi:MAG: TonB-dependent receptor [Gemmatimonadota bacterium]|nr:TonB-dependent receptor [Gemmatimonadota bacterium]